MHVMSISLPGILLLSAFPPASLDGAVVLEVELVERHVTKDQRPPFTPPSEQLTFANERPEGAPAAPAELHGAAWAQLEAGGRTVHVLVGRVRVDGEAPELAYIDLDADGSFSAAERFELDSLERDTSQGTRSWTGELDGLELRLGAARFPAAFSYFQSAARGLSGRVTFLSWREARAKVDGREYVIAVIDADRDGTCQSVGDRWLMHSAASPPERPEGAYGLSALAEGRYIDGRRFVIRPIGCERVEITAVPADGPHPRDLASHRTRIEHLWFERFDKEREGFIEQRELDTSRPRADQEISWQYVTFDEAVALAAKADKPLFVDVMAFWCVWCYRLDYYTYVDREVATVLSTSYIPVKIIQEQDFAGDYDMLREKMEARGIPAMGIFDPSGDLLHKISGWKKPEDFLADLEQGLAAFRGGEH